MGGVATNVACRQLVSRKHRRAAVPTHTRDYGWAAGMDYWDRTFPHLPTHPTPSHLATTPSQHAPRTTAAIWYTAHCYRITTTSLPPTHTCALLPSDATTRAYRVRTRGYTAYLPPPAAATAAALYTLPHATAHTTFATIAVTWRYTPRCHYRDTTTPFYHAHYLPDYTPSGHYRLHTQLAALPFLPAWSQTVG